MLRFGTVHPPEPDEVGVPVEEALELVAGHVVPVATVAELAFLFVFKVC